MNNPKVKVVVSGHRNEYHSTYKTYILRGGIPFADQVIMPDTKYVIKYDFDLGGGAFDLDFSNADTHTVAEVTYYYIPFIADGSKYTLIDDTLVFIDAEWNGLSAREIKPEKGTLFMIASITGGLHKNGYGINVVTVPENCILEFDGGSLDNGVIVGQDTVFINVGDVEIWGKNLIRRGTWREHSGGSSESNGNIDTIIYHSEYGETAFDYREQFQSDTEGAPEYTPTSVQGVAVTSDNIFLFCLTHNDDVENHKPVVYCFDRYYNMQGYCTLNTNSHLNDATVYNGSIYIPDYHHHKIHYINASTLHTACVNHTTIALSEISVSDIMGQLDYDEESNTFCATFGDASNYHVCIMDTNFNIIKECSTNIINAVADHFNRDVVYQGCVYSKGKVLFDIGLDGQKGFTMAVYDVETDAFEKYISIPFACDFLEGEGMCKDPDTGDIMVCCNNWSYAYGLAFEIGRLLVNKNEVTFNKPFTDGVGYVDMSDTVYVYVNNNPINKNYVPTGSAQYPYRSIMEALTCAKRFGRWLHIFLEDTGIPYYMVGVSTTQMTSLRFGSTGNPTVIAHIVLLNQTHVQFEGINIIASRYTMNRYSIFCVNGFNISVRIARCTITMTENNYLGFGYGTDYYTGANIIVRGCTFNGCNTDSPVYPNFDCKSVAIVANPIVHVYFAGNDVNTFNHCVAIDVISNHAPKVEATSVNTYLAMVFNDAAFIRGQWCPFDGNIFLGNVHEGTGERFESLKDFLKYCADRSCSIIVDGNIVTPAGSMIRGGKYFGVNVGTDDPQVYEQTFISYNYPLLNDAYNYGVYGTTSQRPPSTVVGGGCPYYDTDLFRNIYWNWNRQQWLDADGHPAIRRYGTTSQRPVQKVTVEGVTTGDLDPVNDIGFEYFDTTLGKPIYWNGTAWVDATGTPV